MLTLPKLPNKKAVKSIAVLTSGGDAPGMNAAVRAVTRSAISQGVEVHAIMKGFTGLLEGEIHPMNASSVANIIQRGGTILKTSRCEAFFKKAIREEAAHILRRKQIDALVVIGGDGSFAGAHKLEKETGFVTIGLPGTIDNDVPGTDDTIGFDTAVNTAIGAIDRIRDTASSHDRLFIVEVMGRSTGFIALQVGVGGGAETIVVPEMKESISDICQAIDRGIKRGKTSSIIVAAEGDKGGNGTMLAAEFSKRGHQARVCILGHIQRGGSPTSHDRYLASTLGVASVSYLLAGKSGGMVGVSGHRVVLVPFSRIAGKRKKFPLEPLRMAERLAT